MNCWKGSAMTSDLNFSRKLFQTSPVMKSSLIISYREYHSPAFPSPFPSHYFPQQLSPSFIVFTSRQHFSVLIRLQTRSFILSLFFLKIQNSSCMDTLSRLWLQEALTLVDDESVNNYINTEVEVTITAELKHKELSSHLGRIVRRVFFVLLTDE